jgi:hypothetical protein
VPSLLALSSVSSSLEEEDALGVEAESSDEDGEPDGDAVI